MPTCRPPFVSPARLLRSGRLLSVVLCPATLCAQAPPARTQPAAVTAEQWQSLFDGKTLAGWK
ncbi:MAG: hypothetical protein WCQ89_12050, partial [Verrucomicrobiota bacterium]